MEPIGSNRRRLPILFEWYAFDFQDRKRFMRVTQVNRFYQVAMEGKNGYIRSDRRAASTS